ncbi:MAG: hypothetical protein LBU32_04850 [Clostridiales bacterium]|jgi:hypothetical protein|nr:hypothetical protein [Clostridiales bacterium]
MFKMDSLAAIKALIKNGQSAAGSGTGKSAFSLNDSKASPKLQLNDIAGQGEAIA